MSFNVFFSPHPDDLVYSAFSALTERTGVGTAVIFFNVSRFTRWGIFPKYFVTMMRTLEDKIILTRLRLRTSFLWLEDSSVRSNPISQQAIASRLSGFPEPLRSIFCPMGVGGHPDHLAVRDAAIHFWRRRRMKPQICFYEDLPYAARTKEIESEVEKCVRNMPQSCGRLSIFYSPLTKVQFRRKILFSRLYLTQNDHTTLLTRHAKELGKQCGRAYAERYVSQN